MFDFFKDVRLDFSSVYVCHVPFSMFCGCFVIKYGACLALVPLWLVNRDINGFEFSFMQFIRDWPGSTGETHFTVTSYILVMASLLKLDVPAIKIFLLSFLM